MNNDPTLVPSYRKLTKDEILDLANRIRYEDDIDLPAIRKGVKLLFGKTAHKALLIWGSAYDDENHSHRPDSITVWDATGKELTRTVGEDDYDEELQDFLNELEFGCFMEEPDGLGDFTMLINDTKGLDLPDLYVKE